MRIGKLLLYAARMYAETPAQMLAELYESSHAIMADADREFVVALYVGFNEGRRPTPQEWGRVQGIYHTFSSEQLLT